jgi:hypothetical protein
LQNTATLFDERLNIVDKFFFIEFVAWSAVSLLNVLDAISKYKYMIAIGALPYLGDLLHDWLNAFKSLLADVGHLVG